MALKAIEISVRTPTYLRIGVKIRVPVFWINILNYKTILDFKYWLFYFLIKFIL
jgi:hypothetical protein